MRNYISVYKRNSNNIFGYSSIMSVENIDKLLMSTDYSDGLKDIFLEYKNHLLDPDKSLGLDASRYERIIKKHIRALNKDYIYQFVTLSPDHNLRKIEYTEENINLLNEWCKKWFTAKRYSYYNWVIECGKNEEDPHLHIHFLCRLKHKKQGKNHSRDLKKFWAKYWPNSQLIGKDYYSTNVSGQYFFDKEQYFKDEEKGNHENFMDLGLSGQFNEC